MIGMPVGSANRLRAYTGRREPLHVVGGLHQDSNLNSVYAYTRQRTLTQIKVSLH